MSHDVNSHIIDDMRDRWEALGDHMNEYAHEDLRQDLADLLFDGEWEFAEQMLTKHEQEALEEAQLRWSHTTDEYDHE